MRPPPNPYDVTTWGAECGRGIRYANTGTHTPKPGTKGVVRKISTGRKARGSSATDLAKVEARK